MPPDQPTADQLLRNEYHRQREAYIDWVVSQLARQSGVTVPRPRSEP